MQKCRHYAFVVDGCYGNKQKQLQIWISGKRSTGHNFDHFASKFWIQVLKSCRFIMTWAFFEILKFGRFIDFLVKKVVKNAIFCSF